MNSIQVENKTTPKSKQQIDKDYYQKNKERKKTRRKELYAQQKKQAELTVKQQSGKYYSAKSIRILMTFKEYTELNKDKMKLWTDFNWTLKDCQEDIKEGLGSIEAVMKLEQAASSLIRDYWETTKKEIKKGKNWNSLSEEQQQKLIRYWGYEKARIENGYLETAEQLEKQSQEYLKEIELAKFHEERGKIKCECWQCAESKKIQGKIKEQLFKDGSEEKPIMIDGECSNCYQNKK